MEWNSNDEKPIEVVRMRIDLGHGEVEVVFDIEEEQLDFKGPGAPHFLDVLSANARTVMTLMCGSIARHADLIAKRPKAPVLGDNWM